MYQTLGWSGKQMGKVPSPKCSSGDKHVPCTVIGTGDKRVDRGGVLTTQGSRELKK